MAPVRRKYPNIIFYCFKTALQTTKVRNTLFKANVATTSFALSKIMLKKRITVTDCTRVSSNWIRSNRTKSVPTLKKNSRYNRSSKSFFETFELSCSPKKTLVLFFDAVPNLNRWFHFSLRGLLFLQRGKGKVFRVGSDNKTGGLHIYKLRSPRSVASSSNINSYQWRKPDMHVSALSEQKDKLLSNFLRLMVGD